MSLARLAIEERLVSALATVLIPGASAAEVADEVTDVNENALQQLRGVKEIQSTSWTDKKRCA